MPGTDQSIFEFLRQHPLTPYVREADHAVRKPWYIPERRLLDYLLIYVQEGTLVVTAQGKEHTFRPGEFCLIQPDELHTLRGISHTVTPYLHFDIFYNPRREESFPTRPGQIDLSAWRHLMQPRLDSFAQIEIPIKLSPVNAPRFRTAHLGAVRRWLQRSPLDRLEAEQLVAGLVIDILRDHTQLALERPKVDDYLDELPAYLSLHLAEPLKVEHMATRVGLSPSRFRELFRRRFGVPPHRFLLELRVQHAQELIVTTEWTLAQIASYCGFSDQHHFSKSFKQLAGVTPGAFRRKSRER